MDKGNETEAASDLELTAEEQAYFDSHGEDGPEPEAVEDEAPAERADGETQEQADARARDEKGRFAKKAEKDAKAEAETDEQAEGDPEEQSDDPRKPGFVPHGAMHKERVGRQEAERELSEARERLARLEERSNMLLQMQQQAAQAQQQAQAQPEVEQDPEPDFYDDPKQYVEWQKRQHARELASIKEQLQGQSERQQQSDYMTQVGNAYASAARSFAEQQPDFNDAYQFLMSGRKRELEALGYQPDQIGQIIMNEELQGVTQAMQAGMNPAEMIYKFARARGYTPKGAQEQAEAATQGQQQGNDVQEKIERVARSQAANKSLSQASGTAGAGQIDAQALANMSDHEFDEWISKHAKNGDLEMSDKAFARAFGL